MALKPNTPQTLVDAYMRLVAALGREPVRSDVEAIGKAIVGLIPAEPWMDLNSDGTVNIFDSILAAQVIEAMAPPIKTAGMPWALIGAVALAFVLFGRRG